MSRFEFKLPDLGEGTIDAEIVEWRVKPGDHVNEEDPIVEVMTEKASIEVPSPVTGTVIATTGEPGDLVAVGATLIVFETGAKGAAAPPPPAPPERTPSAKAEREKRPSKSKPAPQSARKPPPESAAAHAPAPRSASPSASASQRVSPVAAKPPASTQSSSARVLTSPSIRRRAREAGIDLTELHGSGPDGRITNDDFDAFVSRPAASKPKSSARPRSGGEVDEVKVIGVRRVIAQRLSESKRTIPHFAYVEEIDVTELESLREHLNAQRGERLTYLPFLALALMRALGEFPQCNAHYDAERGVLLRYRSVHLGIATQTPDGLKVPVVHDADGLSLWALAAEIQRVSEAARNHSATKDELTGSTITVTSLGRLGGIASTPIINAPEVAIVGVNKAVLRPVVVDGAVTVRLVMNLSSSFDHRFVDGYDAAALIQSVKQQLEHPATIFID